MPNHRVSGDLPGVDWDSCSRSQAGHLSGSVSTCPAQKALSNTGGGKQTTTGFSSGNPSQEQSGPAFHSVLLGVGLTAWVRSTCSPYLEQASKVPDGTHPPALLTCLFLMCERRWLRTLEQ